MYKILLMGLAFAAINLIPVAAQAAQEFLMQFTTPAAPATKKTRKQREEEEAAQEEEEAAQEENALDEQGEQ